MDKRQVRPDKAGGVMKRLLSKYSKVIVVFSVAYVSLFIIAVLVLSALMVYPPDALIYGTFAFFGAEAGILGWIKTSEVKREKNNEEAAG